VKPLGLYIHIPFCRRKCAYCDFVSYPDMDAYFGRYVRALIAELRLYAQELKDRRVDTVFLGGGTPSLLDAAQIDMLMAGLREACNWAAGEVTVEANPETLDEEKLAAYAQCGVNRLSIGLQTHENAVLRAIGRRHTWETFERVFAVVRSFFSNISADTMFGLPGQTVESYAETVRRLIALGADHVSAYALKLEPGTPLAQRFGGADEDTDRAMYHDAAARLQTAGYAHYETSNFAKPGFACRHNLKYWTGAEYLGLGVAAHSFLDGTRRFSNTEDLSEYLRRVETGERPVARTETLDEKDTLAEYLMLRLRLASGIDATDFSARFGGDFWTRFAQPIGRVQAAGLIRRSAQGVEPTLRGFDLQNTLIGEFMKNI